MLAVAGCATAGGGTSEAPALPADAVRAQLILDDELCRNSSSVEAFDIAWSLAEPAPRTWQGPGPHDGHVARLNDQDAVFIADDGTRLQVTTGPTPDVCFGW